MHICRGWVAQQKWLSWIHFSQHSALLEGGRNRDFKLVAGLCREPTLTCTTVWGLSPLLGLVSTYLKKYTRQPRPPDAAKSLQSCLTLCDPIDGSPPGSSIPGILQARILEWGAISFSTHLSSKTKAQEYVYSCLSKFLAPPWAQILK